MKILIADKISSKAIEKLESAKYDVVYEPEITPTDLLTRVADVQALIIRSRTKVTKEVIEAGKELKIVGRVGTWRGTWRLRSRWADRDTWRDAWTE
jgi:D-3-phosphoglycerate dehydrogenase